MPTFSRNRSRSEISRRISRATCLSVSDSSTSSSHSSARRADSAQKSSIRVPADEHRARLRAQPRAAAHRARAQRHELLDLLARPLRVGLAVAALEVRDDPLEARRVGALAPEAVAVGDLHRLAVRPVQEQVALLVAQLLPRRVQVDVVALGDRLGHLLVVVRRAVRPRRQRALGDRQRRVGHDQLGVDLHLRAQARAALARAVRRVEREDPRLELDQRRPVLGAGEALGEREQRPRLRVPRRGRSARPPRARPSRPLRALASWPTRRRATLSSPALAAVLRAAARSPRSRSRPARRRARPPSRSSPPGACARRGASPGGRPPPRCRACSACRARSTPRACARDRRSSRARSRPRAAPRAACRTRPCARARPARAP